MTFLAEIQGILFPLSSLPVKHTHERQDKTVKIHMYHFSKAQTKRQSLGLIVYSLLSKVTPTIIYSPKEKGLLETDVPRNTHYKRGWNTHYKTGYLSEFLKCKDR